MGWDVMTGGGLYPERVVSIKPAHNDALSPFTSYDERLACMGIDDCDVVALTRPKK